MPKESGLLESFSECQTALQHFQLPQYSSKSSPQQFQHQQWAGLWMQFLRRAQCFIRTPGTPDQKFFPVHTQEDGLTWQNWSLSFFCCHQQPCAYSGQEHLRPTEGLWLCLESSTAAWGRASSLTEGPQQIKSSSVPSAHRSYMGAHVHTHNSHILGAPSKGQEAFPCHTTDLKHNRMVQGPPALRELWTMELFKSSSIPIIQQHLSPRH